MRADAPSWQDAAATPIWEYFIPRVIAIIDDTSRHYISAAADSGGSGLVAISGADHFVFLLRALLKMPLISPALFFS